MIETLDIMKPPNTPIYFGAFRDLLNDIASSSDRNAGNYRKFFMGDHCDRLAGNIGLDIVTDDGDIIAFSSLYGNGTRYPTGYARALNRFWLHPDHRRKSLSGYHGKSVGSTYMLPAQIERAKESGLEAVFVTMEFLSRRPALAAFANYNEDLGFTLLPHMYNTCGNVSYDKQCWQNIAVKWLGDSRRLPLPRMEIEEWQERFS